MIDIVMRRTTQFICQGETGEQPGCVYVIKQEHLNSLVKSD